MSETNNRISSNKSADQWFEEYGVCHQNATNKLLHWICIPAIVFSLVALLWSIPVPAVLLNVAPWFNWAILLLLVSSIFYLRLSISLGIGMILFWFLIVAGIVAWERTGSNLVTAALTIFVVAWIGQFVGHKIEGKKPAFIDDLKFLLIGPLWLLGFIYRRLGIRY
ncbi:MAG: Mpo1-like protein [Planctomycetota bacterium]